MYNEKGKSQALILRITGKKQIPLFQTLLFGTIAISQNVEARRKRNCKATGCHMNIHIKKFGVSAQTTHPMGRQSILQQEEVTSVRSSWLLLRNLRFEALMHIVHIIDHLCHLEQLEVVVGVGPPLLGRNE